MAIKRSTPKIKNSKLEKNPKTKIETPEPGKNPDVIVDFEYDDGLLFIVIENIGNDSAYDTAIRFNKKILGMQKTKNISSLKIFQSLKFLPPGKKIKILVDLFQFYWRGKQPIQIRTGIFFRNKLRKTFQNSIKHDLSIYKDIAEIYCVKKII
jgi:hypothetical protein